MIEREHADQPNLQLQVVRYVPKRSSAWSC
jgi:hypothetical protein